jgi:hypothetical protein
VIPDRFERFNIVVAILLAGWVPSLLMLVVSYTILTNTLESKILRDRQTFVQIDRPSRRDDFSRTSASSSTTRRSQTSRGSSPALRRSGPRSNGLTQGRSIRTRWSTASSSPRRTGGCFLASADPPSPRQSAPANLWREAATIRRAFTSSAVHQRAPDRRLATNIVGAVRAPDGTIVGYLGISVLVERMGRRLSTIEFADKSICQILDQNGVGLFANNFQANTERVTPQAQGIIDEIRSQKRGHLDRLENLYSFSPIDTTGWMAVVEQPKAIAYKPVKDLLGKITFPAVWLILLTAVGAWLAGKFTRRQAEAARRIEREVIFNEKILANMPSGIALVDPSSRNFLQANEAFAAMARQFGGLAADKDIYGVSYDEVKIAPPEAIEKVLAFGAPFQMVEQSFTDGTGATHFVNVNLLRLQGSEQRVRAFCIWSRTRRAT